MPNVWFLKQTTKEQLAFCSMYKWKNLGSGEACDVTIGFFVLPTIKLLYEQSTLTLPPSFLLNLPIANIRKVWYNEFVD